MSEELKPCPFCFGVFVGGTSHPMLEEVQSDDGGGWRVVCYGCHAQTSNGAHQTKGAAVEHWNNAFAWKELARYKSLAEKYRSLAVALAEALEEIEGANKYEDEGIDWAIWRAKQGVQLAQKVLGQKDEMGVIK